MNDRVPPGFGRTPEGGLAVAGRAAEEWAADAGDTPLFIYVKALLDARVASFRAAMPAGLQLHYAVKANPFAPLLAHMGAIVDGFDIASEGELRLALAAGVAAGDISFAGPGKRDRELEAAIRAGVTLNVESPGELHRAGAIARRLGVQAIVALRVNPPFSLKGSGMRMGGLASPFGVDAAQAPELLALMARGPFRFAGFHIFAGSQNLNAQAILDCQRQAVALAADLATASGMVPPLVNLGGGFGVPYFPGDTELDIGELGRGLREIFGFPSGSSCRNRFCAGTGAMAGRRGRGVSVPRRRSQTVGRRAVSGNGWRSASPTGGDRKFRHGDPAQLPDRQRKPRQRGSRSGDGGWLPLHPA